MARTRKKHNIIIESDDDEEEKLVKNEEETEEEIKTHEKQMVDLNLPTVADCFYVESDAFDGNFVKAIECPRKHFPAKKHSNVVVSLEMSPKALQANTIGSILKALKKDKIIFNIVWFYPEFKDNEKDPVIVPVNKFELVNAKIQAIDFGIAGYKKQEYNTITMEIVYDYFKIDTIDV